MARHILETFHVENTNLYFRRYSDGEVEIGTEVNKTFTVLCTIISDQWDLLVKMFEMGIGAPAAIPEVKNKRRKNGTA